MADDNTFARSLHDIGLAAWFGGTLMGATGLNGAVSEISDPLDRTRAANAGWRQWTPLQTVAIALHLLGGAQLLRANMDRVAGQQGVGAATAVKLGLTAAALGVSAYSGVLQRKMLLAEEAGPPPIEGGTTPAPTTPPHIANVQRQLGVIQWALPVLTGGILVVSARLGEQQRPAQVTQGLLQRLTPGA